MKKKGMFFTIMAILLLTFFLLSLVFVSNAQERNVVQKRVESLDSFVFSAEEDLSRQIYISGFRIIFLFEKRIVENGTFISNFPATFDEAFYNGTIYGQPQSLMTGATFSEIKSSLENKARKINANASLFDPSILVTQDDPWHVKVVFNSSFFVEDKNKLASWNKSISIVGLIPVEGFEDPLYVVNTNGLITNKITKSLYTNFVSGSDVQNLLLHLTNSYYIASASAPSFLDRLQGNVGANLYGIESLVNLEKLSSQGVYVKDKSVVDYIYFSTANPSSCNVIPNGLPSWFKLDNEHLTVYQVNCL
ncbi:MAG: hypothetical protein AABX73_01560 [Nanoarchaeota archaeon]